jgi:peptidoglycan/xylan/chitin deacetylase (PgdA/CDA1 family)
LLILVLPVAVAGCRGHETQNVALAPAPTALTAPAALTPAAQAATGPASAVAALPADQQGTSYDWSVPAEFRGHVFGSGKKGFPEKLIALTIDDGPSPTETPVVLAILRKFHVHATFFVLGYNASCWPKLVTQEAADGNCVGIHSYSHLGWSTPEQAAKNLNMTAAMILKATGKKPTIFRPPYGIVYAQKNPKYNNTLTVTARHMGYPVILWSMSSADTSKTILHDATAIAKNVIHTPNPGGAFVLMHDGSGHLASAHALEQIIPQLQAKGWKFVTIPELLRAWAAWRQSQPAPAAGGGTHA